MIGLFVWTRAFAQAEPHGQVTIVDLLVVYTPDARIGAGGSPAIQDEIRTAVIEANLVLLNSLLNTRVRLVHAAEIQYQDSGSISNDLFRLRSRNDGNLDDVHELRNLFGADLACLVVEQGNDYLFYGLQGPSPTNPFSVIQRRFLTGNYFFPVTLSFNFGCQLERPHADSVGAFPYSYGHSFETPGVMTYGTVESLQPARLPWFSNPRILFQNIACGVEPGLPFAADNARTISQTASIVASFRGSLTRTAPPTLSIVRPIGTTSEPFIIEDEATLHTMSADADGTVVQVDFYETVSGGAEQKLLRSVKNSPFTFLWTNVPAGDHTIFAVAYDDSGASSRSTQDLVLSARPMAPRNDNFADAIELEGADLLFGGRTTAATRESGEPDWGGGSVWYSWTAPSDGRVRLTLPAWPLSIIFAAFTGSSTSNLMTVGHNLAGPTPEYGWYRTAEFHALAGTNYHIAVVGLQEGLDSFTIQLNLTPPPANDLFENRTALTGANANAIGNNIGGTAQVGEPEHLPPNVFGTRSSRRTVWWTWTAPADGELTLSTAGSDFTTILGVYTELALTELIPVHRIWRNNEVPARWNVTAGETFQIAVDGAGGAGTIRLSLSFVTNAPNDRFLDAITLFGTDATVQGSNVGASHEPGEPIHSEFAGEKSVWWQWTALLDGYVTLTNEAAVGIIAVYVGDSVSSLTQITSSAQSSVRFAAQAGTAFRIAVAGQWDRQIPIRLRLVLSTIVFAEPLDGAVFSNPVTLNLLATATENDGILKQVRFYSGTTLICIASNAPYTCAWPLPSPGRHTLRIEAIDAQGTTRESRPIQVTIRPANDDFSNRTTLTGTSVVVTNSNLAATLEPAEPPPVDLIASNSLWWSWSSPLSARFTLNSPSGHTIRLFQGTTLSELVPLGSGILFDFAAVEGTAYQIAAIGSDGDVVLQLFPSSLFIASPAPGTRFTTGNTVEITVSAGINSVDFERVDLYRNGVLWETRTELPFGLHWTNAPGGDYTLAAIGIDRSGTWYYSAPVYFEVRPPNDNFQNSITLTGVVASSSGSNLGATTEAGEPAPGIWWSWTAPATGSLYLSALGQPLEPVLSIFTGASISQLTLVTVHYPNGIRTAGELHVTAGETYHIMVTGTYPHPTGTVDLNLRFADSPPNDDFANAILLTGTTAVSYTSNITASAEQDEPPSMRRTVWWRWTAPVSGAVSLGTTGSTFLVPKLAVYIGSALTNLMLQSNALSGLVFNAVAGTTYHISVDANGGGQVGDIRLSFAAGVPENDMFFQRTLLTGTNVSAVAHNRGATREPGEPMHDPVYGGSNSVWWSWTAPAAGTLSLGITGDGFTPVWSVYTGSVLSALQRVANIYDFEPPFGMLPALSVRAGETFQIAVDGFGGAAEGPVGMILLHLGFVGLPTNDSFSNRAVIEGSYARVFGNTSGATRESGEPAHSIYPGGRSIWWTWTAPTSGWVTLDAKASAPDAWIAVYTGDTVSNLVRLAGENAKFTPVQFQCEAGVSYQIALDHSRDNIFGPVTFSFLFSSLRLNAPLPESVFYGPQNIAITAEATVWDGAFDRMEFLASGGLIGVLKNAPYVFTWTNAPLGDHWLQARVTDADGVARTSPPNLIHVRPENDNFERRIPITGYLASFNAIGINASLEPQEPPQGSGSVWWSYIAPRSGKLTLSKPPDIQLRFVLLIVYTGSSLEQLILVTNTPANGSGTLSSSITFDVSGGTEYQIAVAGAIWELPGMTVTLNLCPRPINDNFADSAAVIGSHVAFTASNACATREPLEPNHLGASSGRSVWFTWQAPISGRLVLASDLGFTDLVMACYTGDSLTNLAPVGGTVGMGPLVCDIVAGTVYQLVIDTRFFEHGQMPMNLDVIPPPPNDDFAERSFLLGNLPLQLRGNNLLATSEPSESLPGGADGKSLWWTWTAPTNGTAFIQINNPPVSPEGSSAGPLIAVFTGDAFTNMTLIASNNFLRRLGFQFVWNVGQELYFPAAAGTTYHISVDSCNGSASEFTLQLSLFTPPQNDNFADRFPVAGTNALVLGNNISATLEVDEPIHGQAGGASVWWTWIAPERGEVNLQLTSTFSPFIGIYTGASVNTLTPVAFGAESTLFFAEAGMAYQIAVDGAAGEQGQFDLSLAFFPAPANDMFAAALPIQGTEITVPGSTVHASIEPGELKHPWSVTGESVWYVWRAPVNGDVSVTIVAAPGFPAAYVGSSVSNLMFVLQTFSGDGYSTAFYALAGQTYYFAVSEGYQILGNFRLTLKSAPLAPRVVAPTSASDIGRFRFEVAGELGQSFSIQASTNLVHWKTIAVETLLGSRLHFEDPAADQFDHRFYRVLPLEAAFSPPRLELTGPLYQANNGCTIPVHGPAGQPFILQASDDLQFWNEIYRGWITGTNIYYLDEDAKDHPRRFYRAVSVD